MTSTPSAVPLNNAPASGPANPSQSSNPPPVAGSVYEYSRFIDGLRHDYIVSNFFYAIVGGYEVRKIVVDTRLAFPEEQQHDGLLFLPFILCLR